jgi:hypothetical protein
MIRRIFTVLAISSLSLSLHAHHSFPASYVMEEIITLDGIVEDWVWRNPHPFLFLSVTQENGEARIWHVEFGNATGMALRGLTAEDFTEGDRLLVVGNPGRDGRTALHYKGLLRPADGFQFGDIEELEQ